MQQSYIFEFIGTLLLVLLGDGVVANVVLNKTKGNAGGWTLISFAWGFAVLVAVMVAGPYSGAHLNPAVSVGLAAAGLFPWVDVAPYIIAQLLGGFTGGLLVYFMYKDHFNHTEDKALKLAVFCTAPEIRNNWRNFLCECIATLVLVFVVFYLSDMSVSIEGIPNIKVGLGSVGAAPVAFLVVAIGMSLGGTTGYAINPARDLGPRVAHAVLKIKDKGHSDWSYSWIPVAGPLTGGLLAASFYLLLK